MKLNIAKSLAEDIFTAYSEEVYELTLNGPCVRANNDNPYDGTPVPWDATIDINDSTGEVEISGGVGASGFGTCVCTVPIKDFNEVYYLYLEPNDEKARQDLNRIFANTLVITEKDDNDEF